MHSCEVIGLNQGGKPLDVCQQVWEGSKMVGQLENDLYLSNVKAWDVGLVRVDVQKQESMYLQVHQIYHDPPSSPQGGLCQSGLLSLLSSPILQWLV